MDRSRVPSASTAAANPGGLDAEATVKMPGDENRNASSSQDTKIIRILTVIAYMCAVSGAAFMLSLYYVFIWDPKSGQSGSTPGALVQILEEGSVGRTTPATSMLKVLVANLTDNIAGS